ncbi:MAG: T9SS type A sorting domain-containing protein, partial [Bacteroidota bacterium]
CEGPADSATLIIQAIPSAPVTSDTVVCENDSVPGLTAAGSGIIWYSDAALTTVAGSGSPFVTGDTAAGTFTYFATQTLNGCESQADSATLTIQPIPGAPVALDTAVCFGDSVPGLIAAGSNLVWYVDAALTNPVGNGSPFMTGDSTAGSFTYFVTQTINGCEGPADTATLTIQAAPAAPFTSDTAACENDTIPGLIATGSNLTWYSDAGLNTTAGVGSPFLTGDTAAGTFTYYVTQTVNGCEGPADSATLIIQAIPSAPVTSDTVVCENDSVPGLTAAGTGITWYSDAALTTVAGSGSPFVTGDTAAGTFTYFATQTLNGCESQADSATLTIQPIPAAPVALDTQVCELLPVPDLTAVGSSIRWYSDPALGAANLAHVGDTFATGLLAVGADTFFVTQTVNGCESPADPVTLTITPSPVAPIASDTAICFGLPTPDLSALGTAIQWYDDPLLTNQVLAGDTLATGLSAPGTYVFYATQTVNGCEGPADTVTLTIAPAPAIPVAADTASCFGAPTPDLIAQGTAIRWYDDPLLGNLVFTGDTLVTGLTAPGTYPFYATQTINGCEGPADTVTLTIHALPAAPVAADTTICFGTPTPDLVGTGTGIQWYADSGLANFLFAGDTLVTGLTAVGVDTFYLTQTINGCEGPADQAILTIIGLPAAPVALDTSVCFDVPVPGLSATGSNLQWYGDTLLNNLLFAGDTLITGVTAPGDYPFFVTQTVNGCEGPADTALLTIRPLPALPLALDTTACQNSLIPNLFASGTNVQWYADGALTTLLHQGNSFASGDSAIGTYTYFVTQSLDGCQGPADTVVLTIVAPPAPPLGVDTFICYGEPTPLLTATGTNVRWYQDPQLITPVGSGNTLAVQDEQVGIYFYFASQTVNGCESAGDTVSLAIGPRPLVTLNTYQTSIQVGDSVALQAFNAATYSWSPPIGLNTTTGPMVMAAPTSSQAYTVTGTNLLGCSNDTSVLVEVFPVGIDLPGNPIQDLRVYPNPTRGLVTVAWKTPLEEAIMLQVRNSLGQVILSRPVLSPSQQQQQQQLDLAPFAQGIYYLEVRIGEQSVFHKLIVQ